MKSKIVQNYLYNIVYQILVILLPLITTPYLSRTLGAENIGVYSYTLSIATYFMLFGSLGISLYGQREIAYEKNNTDKRAKAFYELCLLKIITMSFAITTFYLFFCQNGEYNLYFKILILEMLANIIDISWFFQGIEEFKKTVLRNMLVKMISLISIFIFVRSPNDLPKYFIIYTLSNFLGNLTLWLYLPKYISKIKLKALNIKKHLKPVLLLFVPQIAAQIYLVLDKVMIGTIVANKAEVGYYEQAQKLVKIFLVFVTSLSTVMLSRTAMLHSNGEHEKIINYVYKSIRFSLLLNLPIIFGLLSIASIFVPLFYGPGYEKVIPLLCLMSPILVFIGISSIIGTQYLLPTQKNRQYTISIITGAVINFILNLILIRFLDSIGATIATVLAELSVVCTQLIIVNKQIQIKKIFQQSYKYILSAFIMFCSSLIISKILNNVILKLFVEVTVSIAIYSALVLVLKDELCLNLAHKIFKKNRSKKQ